MYKNPAIFILFYLFISCSSDYMPMEKKSKYGEDVCGYYDKSDYYVKPCEKGKYCVRYDDGGDYTEGTTLSICQDAPTIEEGIKTLDEKCSSDFECEYDLKCKGQKCVYDGSCNANEYPYKTFYNPNLYNNPYSSPYNNHYNYRCGKKAPEGYCYKIEYTQNSGQQYYFGNKKEKSQICGVYTFHNNGNNNFEVDGIKYDYIGNVKNGEYVSNEILCKSGFALFFYPEGYLDDPYSLNDNGSNNEMFLRCVTPVAIDKIDKLLSNTNANTYCVIYYKDDDDDTEIKKYNVEQLYRNNIRINGGVSTGSLCPSYSEQEFKLKIQKFKEYYTSLTDDEREKCGDLRSTSHNRYTCENKDLIKSWYFYENPKEYIVYNNREKLQVVLNHLIQKQFPLYDFSSKLNIKYLISLLILFYL